MAVYSRGQMQIYFERGRDHGQSGDPLFFISGTGGDMQAGAYQGGRTFNISGQGAKANPPDDPSRNAPRSGRSRAFRG